MNTIRKYGWALKIVGAALLIGLAVFLYFGDTGEQIVVTFVGAAIIIYSAVRLVPFVRTQGSDLIKTINIMEITVDVMIGIFLIIWYLMFDEDMGSIFGYLFGPYLIIRGAVHFYGISAGKEKSDHALYFFHIGTLIVGSYILFYPGGFEASILLLVILIFSVGVGGFLIYDGGKGYKVYRYEKAVYQQEVKVDEEVVEKELPITDEPEAEQDTIVS